MQEGTTIYFVRHGRTFLNKYHCMQGWSDTPLTPEGEEGAIQAGKEMANLSFDAVYTSDLSRTMRTAKLLLQENRATDPNIRITQMPEFREVFFGSFEGKDDVWTYDYVAKKNGYESADDMRAQLNHAQIVNAIHRADPYHDAETFSNFWHRVESGLIQLIQRHRMNEDKILVVCHGACIKYILENIIPEPNISNNLPNAAVSKVRYHDGQFHLDYFAKINNFLPEG